MAIPNAGGVYTSISGLQQLQHPSIWLLRPEASCICEGQTPEALHVEQTAVSECKRLGDGKLGNAKRCERFNCSLTPVDNRDVLEHRNAAR